MSFDESLSLSDEQKIAAYTFDAPICVLAGAGSGKTRVITHRIAHLVREKGVMPRNILGVTFTNKAAREMRERVERLLPNGGREVLLGTFHGLSARFLRSFGDAVGVDRDFLIYDEDDATRLIKSILKEAYHLSKEELAQETKRVLRLRESERPKRGDGRSSADERSLSVHDAYQERLHRMKALDFFGLLKKFYELLLSDEGGDLLRKRVRHLVVDEYQDISTIQSDIIHALAKKADSVAIVGDDDQSIYGWRGASAHFMQHFLQSFKDAKLFKLEDNYRSTRPILDCANAIIKNNHERLGKNLRSISGDGHLIRLNRHFRDLQEARWVVEQSLRLFEQYGSSFEIAVLMRTNAQSRPLEEALHRARMPYRIVGGMKFYDRKEIKDILAALRAVIYQHSDVDVLRMLSALPLGIGKKTQEALSEYAASNGLSFYQIMSSDTHRISAVGNNRSKGKIDELIKLINDMRSDLISNLQNGEIEILRADEALIYVIEKLGFIERLKNSNDEEAEARLENIEQLVQAAVSFVEEAESYGEPSDAQSFLENVALISKDESVVQDNSSSVGVITLMTLHAAKGLEFDGVFLVGLEEGILPHTRSLYGFDESRMHSALEEERRLLYVGITRAKKRLFLSYCQERFLHGKTSPSLPSRFLGELLPETIDINDRWLTEQVHRGGSNGQNTDYKANGANRSGYRIEYDGDDDPAQSHNSFKSGDRAQHVSYGTGSVISVAQMGKTARVKIRFDGDAQVRTIMATHLSR